MINTGETGEGRQADTKSGRQRKRVTRERPKFIAGSLSNHQRSVDPRLGGVPESAAAEKGCGVSFARPLSVASKGEMVCVGMLSECLSSN